MLTISEVMMDTFYQKIGKQQKSKIKNQKNQKQKTVAFTSLRAL
jgi:hypothetical protein